MLKIGGRPPLAKLPEETPIPPMEEPAPEETPVTPETPLDIPEEGDEYDDSASQAKLPKQLVLYMGSEMGPFQCDNCCYYVEEGQCQKVDGPIDPQGCCNLYCPPGHDSEPIGYDEAPTEPLEEEALEQPEPEEEDAGLA